MLVPSRYFQWLQNLWLSYVTFLIGTAIGDREELNNIDEVFCEGRKDPLYIGAVKSNLGHTEAASGLCSIVKVKIIINYFNSIFLYIHSNQSLKKNII